MTEQENIQVQPEIPAERIVKIDPDGKYIIVFPEGTKIDVIEQAADFLTEWWNDDSNQFCIIGEGAEVIQLEKP